MVLKIVKDLDIQASKLKKRGRINRMNKILKRRNFIEKQIKLTKVPEVYIST
jgi:aminoglycoside N3'-acetyltransferase|tara:strand:- start:528 stop:683 length:156 start_codon:yes stop_codon:yes gene_type:complete